MSFVRQCNVLVMCQEEGAKELFVVPFKPVTMHMRIPYVSRRADLAVISRSPRSLATTTSPIRFLFLSGFT